ncbi:hypothetical protein SDC9_131370 [bioreactor metagenome]|uniref:Uncharacterized protein n=1 Tax=bioreactor metagenome TaxID=1076179 RepID=A0A645D503_9ZZZZ
MFCIVFVIALSIGYTVSHVNHICTGVDCAICHAIFAAEKMLKTIGSLIDVAVIVYMVKLLLSLTRPAEFFSEKNNSNSLFSLKVKLNN